MEKKVEVIRKKAYIYIRVSTKEQVDGASFDVQEQTCRSFAENILNADIVRTHNPQLMVLQRVILLRL